MRVKGFRLRAVAAVAVIAGVMLSSPSTGRCAAGDAQAPPGPVVARSVEISFVGPDGARAILQGAVAPLVRGDSRITWWRAPPPESDRPPPGVFRLRVDAAGDGVVRIVALVPERPPAARAIEARELDPVTAEVVAQIVGATARALLAGETVFAPAATPPAPGPAPSVWPVDARAGAGREATLVAAAPPAPPPTRAREVAISVGYLARAIFFGSPTADPPLAHGGTVRVSLFPATSWNRARLFAAFSFEYYEVRIWDPNGLWLTDKGGGTHAVLGLAGRPLRFLEIGAGLGGGFMYARGNEGWSWGSWTPVARGLVSVAAVALPTGVEVTAAFTAEAVRLAYPVADAGPSSIIPRMNWFQPGALLTLGWRR